MATFVKVAERKDKRKASTDTQQRWYERTWYVETQDVAGAGEVTEAFGIPQLYTIYATSTETDLAARVVRKTARQLSKTDIGWEVTVRYETRPGGDDDQKWEENPLNRRPRMSFAFEDQLVGVQGTLRNTAITPDSTDIFEEPIENTAKQPFDPQPQVEDGTPILVVERNEASFSPAAAIEYNNSVNSDFFMDSYPRQLKVRIECPGAQSEIVNDEEVVYYPVRYTFKGRREGWDLRIANRGTEFLDTGSTNTYGTFATTKGHVYFAWLNADGTAATSSPNYIRKQHYREKPFADFNLPNEFI